MKHLDDIIGGLCICTAPRSNNLPEVESRPIVVDTTIQPHEVSAINRHVTYLLITFFADGHVLWAASCLVVYVVGTELVAYSKSTYRLMVSFSGSQREPRWSGAWVGTAAWKHP